MVAPPAGSPRPLGSLMQVDEHRYMLLQLPQLLPPPPNTFCTTVLRLLTPSSARLAWSMLGSMRGARHPLLLDANSPASSKGPCVLRPMRAKGH